MHLRSTNALGTSGTSPYENSATGEPVLIAARRWAIRHQPTSSVAVRLDRPTRNAVTPTPSSSYAATSAAPGSDFSSRRTWGMRTWLSGAPWSRRATVGSADSGAAGSRNPMLSGLASAIARALRTFGIGRITRIKVKRARRARTAARAARA